MLNDFANTRYTDPSSNPSTIVPIVKFTKSFNIEPHTHREVSK